MKSGFWSTHAIVYMIFHDEIIAQCTAREIRHLGNNKPCQLTGLVFLCPKLGEPEIYQYALVAIFTKIHPEFVELDE